MSAQRFLLLVEQLTARAEELWKQEEAELSRGAELMVIKCKPQPLSPQHHQPFSPSALRHLHQEAGPTSPAFHSYDPAGLLHPPAGHASTLSPSLIPAAHAFNSPCWSNDFNLIAAQLGLGSAAATTSDTDDAAHGPHGSQPGSQQRPSGSRHAGCTEGAGPGPGSAGRGHESQPGSQPGGCLAAQGGQGAWPSSLGLFADAEALITLPNGILCGSATARTAKARLLDKFEGTGPASARHGAGGDPFSGLLSGCTPSADDFGSLASPSWGQAYL
ncbi:hypothetical protein HYH03_001885 [Edaphochlamys debaryana]|uniref:Uncharacterized protein n=1 Tax=Edaphochlamys debaryana TaxID=47281 RepID=A0A835YEJ3_9CHLO|nr:hypothetical protein HYH03_001885 [Edaphochlamys debaryana]|eukprot:KAG2500309.1 hypothetical protein HYH03_001885 [Edaphochlamys debaryana]